MRRLLYCALVAACSSPPSPTPKAPVSVKPVATPTPPQTPLPPAAAPAPVLEQLADATCIVAEAGQAADDIPLRFHGMRFALIDTAGTFELRANDKAATMHVVTDELDLTGEVDVHDVSLRPREPRLQDGWFEIRSASVSGVEGDQVRLDLYVPSSLRLADGPPRTFACAHVALSELPSPKFDGTWRMLRAGRKVSLYLAPKQPSFGTVEFPLPGKDDSEIDRFSLLEEREVAVLAKKGSWSKIRLDEASVAIEAWVKNKDLEPVKLDSIGGLLGSMKSSGPKTPPLFCTGPVPVYVRASTDVVNVGVIRPNGEIRRETVDGDEIPIFLGGYDPSFDPDGVEATLTPFVRAADLADCTEVAP